MGEEKRCGGSIKKALWSPWFLAMFLCVACAEFSFPPQEVQTDPYGNLILPLGPYQVVGDPGDIIVGAQLPVSEQGEELEGVLTYWKVGEEEEPLSVPFRPVWDQLQYVRLSGLSVGDAYQMKVSTAEYSTVNHAVRAPTPSQNSFSFLAIGDTKPYPSPLASQLVQQMSKRSAAFYVHLGDFARKGDHVADWSNFLKYHRPLLSKMPILPVIGNHDRSKNRVFSNIFLLPLKYGFPTRYYQFSYGNTLMIVLDSYSDHSAESHQYQFLKRALERSTREDIEHVFIASHKPFYSSGNHGGSADFREKVLGLIENYSVTAVLASHDHSYQRTRPINGIVHIVSGGGGATLTKAGYEDYTAKALKVNHFVEVSVDGPRVTLRAFDKEGKLIDEARIK